jgi:hypothetical protein
MKGAIILKGFIGMFFMISIPQWALAIDGKPVGNILFNHTAISQMQSDTIPPPKKNMENNNQPGENVDKKPVAGVIKVVPKARRQSVPIPVNVKVKPVKIITPIIKPVIRILH